ncbi:helix-turn-helix domain-containing transcriptional regulator [Achromobacter sp. NCFB-sbj8-Ac1-l]|uniref:helix-turn-helix domain-containing transcriptional regulator n=1 Tax=unclassified Achromobacter TaxID=2626865 RepID=UPI004046DB09
MRSKPNDQAMAEMYRDDPAFALELVNQILADGDQEELLIVLRQMALAFGGMQMVAEQARLNPTQLYRTLSPKGNPALSSLLAILRAMGLRLAVAPLAQAAPAPVRMG